MNFDHVMSLICCLASGCAIYYAMLITCSFVHICVLQLPGIQLQNVTYEIENQISPALDLPFYINHNQVMVNVSRVQKTGLNTSYDVVISAVAALDSTLLRQLAILETGRVHTVICLESGEKHLH